MGKTNTIARNAAVLTLSGLTVKTIGFFFRIPLGRLLTASGMGDYSPAYEIYSFALLFSTAGLPVAIAKMIAERNAVGELENSKKVFRISRLLMMVMGLVGFLVLFVFSDNISHLIGLESSSLSIKATSFALLFVPLLAAYRGYFQGSNNMVPTAISEIIEQLLRVVFGLLFAVLLIKGFEISGVLNEAMTVAQLRSRGAAGACMGASVGACGALIFIRHKYRTEPWVESGGSVDKGKDILLDLLAISFPITLTAGVVSIVNLIDISIVQTQLLKLGYD